MAANEAIVEYTANDGQEVVLSPSIVANYIVSGDAAADPKDVYAFMAKCRARGLNPLAGDAYMTTYRNRDGSTSSSVIVSKDYFMRTATVRDDFDGMEAGIVVVDKSGQLTERPGTIYGPNTERLVGGWATVHVKGRAKPSYASVSMAEYDQHRSLWKTKPATMIRKVAVTQALREAYPGAFGGLYDSAEMPEREAPARCGDDGAAAVAGVAEDDYEEPEYYEEDVVF